MSLLRNVADDSPSLAREQFAALGINNMLVSLGGVSDEAIWRGMSEGVAAIEREFGASGTDDERRCLSYVLHETAGSLDRLWPHNGHVMDVFSDASKADGRHGKPFAYFVEHPNSRAAGLLPAHVLALRLYTTAAYSGINNPLRGKRDAPHPFPVVQRAPKQGPSAAPAPARLLLRP